MKFDIDSKIAQNKERLKYDHENIRNLQNAYGYIVIYLSFIGLTFFDFIKYLSDLNLKSCKTIDIVFIILVIASMLLIIITLIFYINLFLPKKIAHDKLPKFIYSKMFKEVGDWAKRNNKNPEKETKEAYLELLERAVQNNFKIYAYKRNMLYRSIVFALLSFIPYFIAMILYNLK